MIRLTTKFNVQEFRYLDVRDYTWMMLKKFWRFSNFYGEYCSLPPSQRQQFLQSRQPTK